MKKIISGASALMVALCITVSSCGPNGDGNSMDPANSDGEGAVDSTRLTNFDTSSASISAPSYLDKNK